MTAFDDRVKRFETEYLHEQELLFKIKARRNRIFAEWTVNILGIDNEKADVVIQALINFTLQADGEEKAVNYVGDLFDKHENDLSDHRIDKEFMACFEKARDQIMNET